jgi:hypothetical protein
MSLALTTTYENGIYRGVSLPFLSIAVEVCGTLPTGSTCGKAVKCSLGTPSLPAKELHYSTCCVCCICLEKRWDTVAQPPSRF